jgi:hypothetical protein
MRYPRFQRRYGRTWARCFNKGGVHRFCWFLRTYHCSILAALHGRALAVENWPLLNKRFVTHICCPFFVRR